jgi:hypothetical protein
MERGEAEEDEAEENKDKEEENEYKERDVSETRIRVDSRSANVLTFRDVEQSMSTFSGDNNINEQNWLLKFEEMMRPLWLD